MMNSINYQMRDSLKIWAEKINPMDETLKETSSVIESMALVYLCSPYPSMRYIPLGLAQYIQSQHNVPTMLTYIYII